MASDYDEDYDADGPFECGHTEQDGCQYPTLGFCTVEGTVAPIAPTAQETVDLTVPDNVQQPTFAELKRVWLNAKGCRDEEELHAASHEFDAMFGAAMREVTSSDMPSQTEMLMEMILELDTATRIIPPKVKAYRDLLVAQGLDKVVSGQAEAGPSGMSMPGINLADQASLAMHQSYIGLIFSMAEAEVQEKMRQRAIDKGV